MELAYFTHPDCKLHEIAPGHPEQPARIQVVDEALQADPQLQPCLLAHEPAEVTRQQLLRAHSADYIDRIEALSPAPGERVQLDPDTAMNAASLRAAKLAAGSVCGAIDAVIQGDLRRAFCNIRPPGHHAEHDKAMGFCIFSSLAIGALHALDEYQLERVVVVDFDVHFGNGSSDILRQHPKIRLLSSCQFPLYPLDSIPQPGPSECNITLAEGSDGEAAREAISQQWLPALQEFAPQLMLISAGFDAHAQDPLAGLNWQAEDYHWITEQLIANCDAPIVSSLEGGYHLSALATSATAHVRALCGLNKHA